MARRPNIVFIFPDQQRGDTVGFAGNPVVKTPNLDRLAAESVVFTRCSTNSPLCMPARMSLMCGLPVNKHGMWANNIAADPDSANHVRNIRDAGYHTSQIGKVHLHIRQVGDGHARDFAYRMHAWGFDDTHELRDIVAYAAAVDDYTDFLADNGNLDAFRHYMRTYMRGENQRLIHPWETPPSVLPYDQDLDTYCAQKSAEWIRDYDDDKPFYLQVMFPGPHNPFDSPADDRALYNPEEMPPAILDPATGPVSRQVEGCLRASRMDNMTPSQVRLMRAYYYAKVTHIDHGIGMVMQALSDKGVLDDTWIIYTSDHGEMLGDHRIKHKSCFYEGAVNVPLCIRPPGGTTRWQSRALTDHLDLVETMLEIAGASSLDGAGHRSSLVSKVVDGLDADRAQIGKDAVYSEISLFTMARSDRYKLNVDSVSREPLELYDMDEDADEVHNLVEDPSHSTIRDELIDRHITGFLDELDQEKVRVFRETDPQKGGWKALEKVL